MKKKTSRQKYLQEQKKKRKEICKFMQIKKAITKYGYNAVMSAMSSFITHQRELKRLCKKRVELENELKKINQKVEI